MSGRRFSCVATVSPLIVSTPVAQETLQEEEETPLWKHLTFCKFALHQEYVNTRVWLDKMASSIKTTCSLIHFLYLPVPELGVTGVNLSQLSEGEGRTSLLQGQTTVHTHHNSDFQLASHASFWSVGGSQRTWRGPSRTQQNREDPNRTHLNLLTKPMLL